MVSAAPIPQAAPWESVPANEQLFAMITGANSGIGLGVCQRLVDEFLATRSLTAHICIIPTTRSATKSLECVRTLREYVVNAAQTSQALRARAGGDNYKWQDTVARVHILSLPLDLCDLHEIYAFADKICYGTVSNPAGLEGEYLTNVRIPRLDSVVFNAAYGGWSGLSYFGAIWSILSKGFMETITYPTFKTAEPTRILNEEARYNYPDKPLLAEVFTACVFGHYVLTHQLLPVLSRSRTETVPPGRVIWTSSVEAHAPAFSISDLQSFTSPTAYESSKRLTDILLLTYRKPGSTPYSSAFLTMGEESEMADADTIPPNMYLTHPGIVASTLFPLPWFIFWAYELALLIGKWMGSPWHVTDGYKGGKSAAWIIMQEQDALDNDDAQDIKWGSAVNSKNESLSKPTEVEGWGFDGTVTKVKNEPSKGAMCQTVGRRYTAKDVTSEELVEFEALGAQCWREMESLRLRWEDILAEDSS